MMDGTGVSSEVLKKAREQREEALKKEMEARREAQKQIDEGKPGEARKKCWRPRVR